MKYTVEIEYMLPVRTFVVVEADSLAAACEKAVQDDTAWDQSESMYDGSSSTYVASIAKGEHDSTYAVGVKQIAVPEEYQSPFAGCDG
jgi:hypothetical protein